MVAKVFISRFLSYKKSTSSIFMVSLKRLTHLTHLRSTQSPTWNPFRTPILAISHFELLGFILKKFEKVFNSFIDSIIDFISLRKEVASSALYKNN